MVNLKNEQVIYSIHREHNKMKKVEEAVNVIKEASLLRRRVRRNMKEGNELRVSEKW